MFITTRIFQIINILILLGIIFAIFYVVVKLVRSSKEKRVGMKKMERKMDAMAKSLDEINTKLNDK